MADLYTHTSWRVKARRQDTFMARWCDWVDWSHREGLAAPAILLRDVAEPRMFVSFGPWESLSTIQSWRPRRPSRAVARLSEVVESFEPRTFEVAARR